MPANNIHVTDKSITSLSGSSQQLLPTNGNCVFRLIQNIGNAQIGVNLAGGTAAIGGAGTVTLQPGGVLVFDDTVPSNNINVIGTAGQPVVCLEG